MEFKVLDKGFIRVIDTMGSDQAVVQAARISYGEGTKTVNEDRGLIRYLMRHWHTTPFEMCEIKVHIKAPIFVARQWMRHRTANINEYSGRYSIMKNEFYIPEKTFSQSSNNKQGRSNNEMSNPDWRVCNLAFECYEGMIEKGVARETARMVLPLSTYTEWYWKIDLHNLLHFLRLRCDEHAQFEIREYANVLLNIVKNWCPLTYEAFMDYRMNSFCLSSQQLEIVKRMLKGESYEDVKISKRELDELKILG